MLVSGVRSSCEASATNSRWRSSEASVSPRAASSSRSISSRVEARSLTSSLATGRGRRWLGSRVRATSRAARVRPAMGAMARRATAKPARKASPVPPRMPSAKNRCSRLVVASSDARGLAYCTNATAPSMGLGDRSKPLPPRSSEPANSGRATTRRSPTSLVPSTGGPRLAAPGRLGHDLAAAVDHPDGGAAGGRGPQRGLGHPQHRVARQLALDPEALLEVGRGGADVVVEVGLQPLLGERADHHGEQQQDHERQRGRDQRQLDLDRQPQAGAPDRPAGAAAHCAGLST